MATEQREQRLSGKEKVAVLLLTVRPDVAKELMEQLPQDLLQRVTKYASLLRDVPPEVVLEIKEEFCETMRTSNALSLGNTREAMKELMGQFMSPDEVEKLTLDLESSADQSEGLEAMKWMDPDTISAFLRNEHPQTTALVLAHLESAQAAQVLGRLKPAVQPEVIMRMTNLDRVSPTVLKDLNQVLKEELISAASTQSETLGGTQAVAEIMNNVDKGTEASIFESMEEINPSVVEEIRERMFTFEDLVAVDNRGMQELTKNISNEQLVLALKTASD